MLFTKPRKLSLQFKSSLVWALVTSLIIFIGCFVLLTLVKVKRSNDLIRHSINTANQLVTIPSIHDFLLGNVNSPKQDEIETFIHHLIKADPFIDELTVFDKPGKQYFRIMQSNPANDQSSPRAKLSLHEVLAANEPIHVEKSGETFVPLSLKDHPSWGVLRIRWKPKATWKYYWLLQMGMTYVTVGSFILTFILSYCFFQNGYVGECRRMLNTLKHICSGDYSQRIDKYPYSPGMKDLGAYINRILAETQESRKNAIVLNETLRQLEKGNSEYRKALNERTAEIDRMRTELREGLLILFDLIWNGVLIIDDECRIHYINDQAESLLRFARFDESKIVDDRLKKCLSPLIRTRKVQRVDDMCVWPQRTSNQSVSCRVRASAIPTIDKSRLYFVLLREESGFPKQRDSSYFSERLVIDVLSSYKANSMVLASHPNQSTHLDFEQRFREFLRKVELYKRLEEGDYGPVTSVRLPIWLQNHFEVEDLFSQYLNIETQNSDMDIVLKVPERALSEFMDALVLLISNATQNQKNGQLTRVAIQPSMNSQGKPVIALILPQLDRKRASRLQDIVEERTNLLSEDPDREEITLNDLELDLCLSIYRMVRKLLRIQVECGYSESKRMATLRLNIENPSFSKEKIPQHLNDFHYQTNQSNHNIINQYLSRI